jgi:hypothetical protein
MRAPTGSSAWSWPTSCLRASSVPLNCGFFGHPGHRWDVRSPSRTIYLCLFIPLMPANRLNSIILVWLIRYASSAGHIKPII